MLIEPGAITGNILRDDILTVTACSVRSDKQILKIFSDSDKTQLGAQIVAFTLQFNGGEYVWGGASPEVGFDCSGMMYYVYTQFGYSICRTASMQYKYNGVNVDFPDLQAGDMVFSHPDGATNVSHVGMYIGDGLFIHAASRSSGIKVSSLYSKYCTAHYLGARRII